MKNPQLEVGVGGPLNPGPEMTFFVSSTCNTLYNKILTYCGSWAPQMRRVEWQRLVVDGEKQVESLLIMLLAVSERAVQLV